MLVGVGEWGFREMPMEDHFRIAKKFGFKFLEFGIGGGQVGRLPEEPTDEDVAAFVALGQEYDIVTPFCCVENDYTLPDAAAHDAMLAQTLKSIRTAKKCGATHMRLFAGFTPAAEMTEEIWTRMFDAFAQSDALCEELGMLISIETHGKIEMLPNDSAKHIHTVSTDIESIKRLLRDLPPRVGFNYDPGNLKPLADGDASLRLDLINDRINYCHLKDWTAKGDGWVAVAIGDDDLDYKPVFDRMTFDGVYQIEYEPLHDVEDGIQRSLDYLKKIVSDVVFTD